MNTQEVTQKITYGDPIYFSMFTDAGNMLVFKELSKILARANVHGTLARRNLVAEIRLLELKSELAGHREVSDTEVRMAISSWLNEYVNLPNGWVQLDYFYDDIVA